MDPPASEPVHRGTKPAVMAAAAGTTRRFFRIPGIARYSMQPVFGEAGESEFRHIGFSHHNGARRLEPCHLNRIAFHPIILKRDGAIAGHHAGGIFQVLDAQGQSGQRSSGLVRRYFFGHGTRFGHGRFRSQ